MQYKYVFVYYRSNNKNKYISTFATYVPPLGAFMAMLFPEPAFTNNSIFLLRNIGLYGTHGIIFIMGMLLFTLGYVKPCFKNLYLLLPAAVVISLGAFLVNIYSTAPTKVQTNYFYTMSPALISLLELFWKLILVKYLYLIPTALIFSFVCSYYKLVLFCTNKVFK